ncbi:MAG TPA: hypothetical protein VF519_00795 [Mycobacteriales bacterium]
MTRLLLAAAVVTAALLPSAASASDIIKFRNPVDGCTYYVYGPTITWYGLPWLPQTSGGVGEHVDCT